MNKNQKNNLFILIFISALFFLLFIDIFIEPSVIAKGIGDNLTGNLPYQIFISRSLKNHSMPLWTSQIFMGFPIIAEAVAGSFNPVFKIFFSMLPLFQALNIITVFSFIFATFGTYLLAQKIGISKTGALISALAWTTSSYFILISDSVVVVTSASWSPWILISFLRLCERTNLTNMTILSFLIGMQLLSTYIQYSLITVLTGLIFYFYYFRIYQGSLSVKTIALPFLPILLAIGLAAIQLMPTAEFAFLSPRFRTNMALGVDSTFTPWGGIISIFLPHLSAGMPSKIGNNSLYIGIIPLILFVMAFLSKTNKSIHLKLIFIVFLLLSLGEYTPLYYITSSLPIFSIFRFPENYLLIATLSMALLAGIGYDQFLKTLKENKDSKIVKHLTIFCAVFTAWLIAAYYFIDLTSPLIKDFAEEYIKNKILGFPGRLYSLEEYVSRVDLILKTFLKKISLLNIFTLFTILAIFSFTFFARKLKQARLTKNHFVGILILLLITNIILTAKTIPLLRFVDYKQFQKPPEIVKYIKNKEKGGKFRIYTWPYHTKIQNLLNYEAATGDESQGSKYAVEAIPVQVNMFYELESIDGYTSLWDYRIKNVLNRIENNDSPLSEKQRIEKLPDSINILSLFNVKYVISQLNINHPKLVEEKKFGNTYLYRNADFLNRVFLVNNYKIIRDEDKILKEMFKPTFNPQKYVLLENKPKIDVPTGKFWGKTKIKTYHQNEVTINVKTNRNSILVLSDAYYPGWKATIDGKSTQILRANYILRAVPIPKGNHRVKFYCQSTYLITGLYITAFSFVTIVILFLFGIYKNKQN